MFSRPLIGRRVPGLLALCLLTLSLTPPLSSQSPGVPDVAERAETPTPTPASEEGEQQPTPTPPPPPTPFAFDQYGDIPRDDAKARLDNFANTLQENPRSLGYLIVYGGQHGRSDEAQRRAEFARQYLINTRGIETGRIATIIGGRQQEATTELTVVPAGAPPPTPIATPVLPPSTPTPTPGQQQQQQDPVTGRVPPATSYRLTANEKYKQALQDALSNLRKGSIFPQPEQSMIAGAVYRVAASVTTLPKEAVEAALPPTTNLKVYTFAVSPKMKARLTGRADEFKIDPKSAEEQPVYDEGRYTTWEWDVTPLKEGTLKLELRTTRIVILETGEEAADREEVETRDITVKVAPSPTSAAAPAPTATPTPESLFAWAVKNADWKWVFTVLIIPVVVYLWKRFFPDRPAAGAGSNDAGPNPGAPHGDGADRNAEDGEGPRR